MQFKKLHVAAVVGLAFAASAAYAVLGNNERVPVEFFLVIHTTTAKQPTHHSTVAVQTKTAATMPRFRTTATESSLGAQPSQERRRFWQHHTPNQAFHPTPHASASLRHGSGELRR